MKFLLLTEFFLSIEFVRFFIIVQKFKKKMKNIIIIIIIIQADSFLDSLI